MEKVKIEAYEYMDWQGASLFWGSNIDMGEHIFLPCQMNVYFCFNVIKNIFTAFSAHVVFHFLRWKRIFKIQYPIIL